MLLRATRAGMLFVTGHTMVYACVNSEADCSSSAGPLALLRRQHQGWAGWTGLVGLVDLAGTIGSAGLIVLVGLAELADLAGSAGVIGLGRLLACSAQSVGR